MPERRQQRGDRALAIGIIGFVAILIIAALLYTLMDPAISEIFTMSTDQTSNQTAKDAISQREKIWDNVLYAALFLAAMTIIGKAVIESRRP